MVALALKSIHFRQLSRQRSCVRAFAGGTSLISEPMKLTHPLHRLRRPRDASMAVRMLDEDSLAAILPGISDNEIEVAIAVDVAERGVRRRIVHLGEVLARPILELRLPVVVPVVVIR